MKLTSSCKSITRNKDLSIYFAYPYFDWECGSNERLNGLFRRFILKRNINNNSFSGNYSMSASVM